MKNDGWIYSPIHNGGMDHRKLIGGWIVSIDVETGEESGPWEMAIIAPRKNFTTEEDPNDLFEILFERCGDTVTFIDLEAYSIEEAKLEAEKIMKEQDLLT